MASSKKEGDHKSKEATVKDEVEGGERLWKGIPIDEVDPDEVFKETTSDLERDGEGTPISSEATFTWSRPGYRGYRGCQLNEDGDYAGYDDGSLVIYNGSLNSDSAWNGQFCKRVKDKETSSDEDEMSSPPSKKSKNDLHAKKSKADRPAKKSKSTRNV